MQPWLIVFLIVMAVLIALLVVFGSLTPKIPESLARLIFLRQINIFLLRTTVLFDIIDVYLNRSKMT